MVATVITEHCSSPSHRGEPRHRPKDDRSIADSDWLNEYLACPSGESFAKLIERHGPMVLSVCRRILRNSADADDAFQATFLVLAMKAKWIRKHDSIADWLYGVAVRSAKTLRREIARRNARERRAMDHIGKPALGKLADVEAGSLDEQIASLSRKYREVIIACYVTGLTHSEAATQLNLPIGTVASRLRRAHEVLRKKLERRQLIGKSESPIQQRSSMSAVVAMPVTLLQTTLQTIDTHKVAGAGAPAPSVSLAKGICDTMRIAKLKMMLAVVVGSLVVVGGTTILAVAAKPSPEPAPVNSAMGPATPAVKQARMQRLRETTLAVIAYVNRHDSHFPNDLGASLQYTDTKLGARTFVTPDDERKAAIPEHATPGWVNEHTSFVYLANGNVTWKRLDQLKSNRIDFPLAYEKFEGHEGQEVVVSFIDGHAEWMPVEKARKEIEAAKRIYDKLR